MWLAAPFRYALRNEQTMYLFCSRPVVARVALQSAITKIPGKTYLGKLAMQYRIHCTGSYPDVNNLTWTRSGLQSQTTAGHCHTQFLPPQDSRIIYSHAPYNNNDTLRAPPYRNSSSPPLTIRKVELQTLAFFALQCLLRCRSDPSS